MPLRLGTSGSVRASSTPKSDRCAQVVHTFCPVTTHSSPSRSARVASEARSEPAPGSLKSWHQISSLRTIGGRKRSRCSSVPWANSAGAARFSPSGLSRPRLYGRELRLDRPGLGRAEVEAAVGDRPGRRHQAGAAEHRVPGLVLARGSGPRGWPTRRRGRRPRARPRARARRPTPRRPRPARRPGCSRRRRSIEPASGSVRARVAFVTASPALELGRALLAEGRAGPRGSPCCATTARAPRPRSAAGRRASAPGPACSSHLVRPSATVGPAASWSTSLGHGRVELVGRRRRGGPGPSPRPRCRVSLRPSSSSSRARAIADQARQQPGRAAVGGEAPLGERLPEAWRRRRPR